MKDIWKKIITIIIILLFLGTAITIALGNIDKIAILWKTP
jgi:cytochrome c-type biogenesis protein CcmE